MTTALPPQNPSQPADSETPKSADRLPAPTMEHVGADGVLDPMNVLEGGVLKVEYPAPDPTDSITVFWSVSPSDTPIELRPPVGAQAVVETPIAVTTLAKSLNRRVEASYVVKRGAQALLSYPLFITVLDLPDSALPAPTFAEVTNPLLAELDLTLFEGDAHIIAKWPLMASYQRVWLFVHAQLASREEVTYALLDGHEVKPDEERDGLNIPVARETLEALRNRSQLRIEMRVTLDGSSALISARAFPVTALTLILSESIGELEGFENQPIQEIKEELEADLLKVQRLTGRLYIRAPYLAARPYSIGQNLRGDGSVKITLHNAVSTLIFGVIRYQYQPPQVVYFDEAGEELATETVPPFGDKQGDWMTYTAPEGRKIKSLNVVTLQGRGFGVDEFTLIE